jgi:hypothetical protein
MSRWGIEASIIGIVNTLIDIGEVDPYEYTGLHESETPKPYQCVLGGKVVAEIKFVMTVRDDGDYDGFEGFNVEMVLYER